MSDASLLGGWVRRFLLEHILGERNLARNTQRSYRDTLSLLIPGYTPRVRPLCGRAQSRTHSVVRPDTRYSIQKDDQELDPISR